MCLSLYQSSVSLIVWGPGLLSTPSRTSKLLFLNEACCWMWSIRSMTCNTSKTFLCFCNLTQSRTKKELFFTQLPRQWTEDDGCLLSQSTTGLVKKLKLQRKESREKTLKKENCQQKVLDGHPEDIRCLSDGPGTRIEQAYRGTILPQRVGPHFNWRKSPNSSEW